MAKIRTVVRGMEAQKLREMVDAGTLRVMAEMVDGKRKYCVTTRSGAVQAVIGEKFHSMFASAIENCGSGDGLFPGFSQTTV